MLVSLYYLLAVEKHENITKAAEELYISQPALSASLKRLEKRLNAELLRRSNSGISLTREGKCVADYARDILLSYECMLNDLKAMQRPTMDVLRIGSGMAHSANVIDEFLFNNPLFPVSLAQYNNFSELKKALLSHEIDLCISSPPIEGANIITKKLCTERLCVAFGMGHDFMNREELSLGDIVESGCILALPAGFSLRVVIDKIFDEAGLEPQYTIQAETNAIAALLHDSRSTGYSAIYPISRCRQLSSSSENIMFRPISGNITRTIAASWLDRNNGSQDIHKVLDFLTGHYLSSRYCL